VGGYRGSESQKICKRVEKEALRSEKSFYQEFERRDEPNRKGVSSWFSSRKNKKVIRREFSIKDTEMERKGGKKKRKIKPKGGGGRNKKAKKTDETEGKVICPFFFGETGTYRRIRAKDPWGG